MRDDVAVLDVVGDALHNHHQGHGVLAALGDDDVGVTLGGFHELLVHGLHGGEVLLHDGVHGAAPLGDVPVDAAEDALVADTKIIKGVYYMHSFL